MSILLAIFLLCLLSARASAGAQDAPPPEPRLVARLAGPGGTAVAFSGDGTRLMVCSFDEARIWDASSFELVVGPVNLQRTLSIGRAAISDDGGLIVTAGTAGAARVWDGRSGAMRHVLQHDERRRARSLRDVQFGPGARTVLSAGQDRAARVWDAETGRPLVFLKHEADVVFARYSPDGSRIVTSTCPASISVYDIPWAAGLLRVWDARTGRELWRKRAWAFGGWVRFALSPDGRRIALVSVKSKSQSVHILDAETGEERAEYDVPREWVESLTYAPDGNRLLASNYRFVRVWDTASGAATEMELDGAAQIDAVFSPDGSLVLTAGWERTASVWNAATGELLLRTPADDRKPDWEVSTVPLVAFSADGRRIAVSSRAIDETTVWDIGGD